MPLLPVPFLSHYDVRNHGARGDGSADDTAAIQAAITAAAAARRPIFFPAGTFKITSPLTISSRGMQFIGSGGFGADIGGTQINYTGTNALFEIGTDSGNPYDTNEYNGLESQVFRNLSIRYTGSSTTALANGQGTYGTGTIGIRDWRGGSIVLDSIELRNFAYGFWGIQSDVNHFQTVRITHNHVGVYLGPRSDQATWLDVYTQFNDTALWFDRAWGGSLIRCQFVGDGSTTTPPIKIGSQWALGSNGILFEGCWFEHTQGQSTPDITAFVEIGVGDSIASENITFRNSTILTAAPAQPYHVKYLVRIENGDLITVDGTAGVTSALDNLIQFTGSTSPRVRIVGSSGTSQKTTIVNSGAGTPAIQRETWDSTARTFSYSTATNGLTFTSTNRVGIQTASPNSNLHVVGSVALTVSAVSADTTLTSGNCIVLVDATGGNRTMSLQAASTMTGRIYVIKKTDASANTVIVDGSSSETIDGALTKTLGSQHAAITIVSDGTNWRIVSQMGTVT